MSFRTDRTFAFMLNDRQLAWGVPSLPAAALYQLAVPGHDEGVFLDVPGGTARLIAPNETIDLTAPGVERFSTIKIKTPEGKILTIIVEGHPHEWPKREINYAEVVTLEVPDYPQHPEITYSVPYERGHGNKPKGILAPGGSVKVKEGMVFHVSPTGQS